MTRSEGSRRLLLIAASISTVCTAENWALGPLSWIYAYGAGLETIPTLLALTFDSRNWSSWAPFAVGGVDRLAFWGNASPFSIEYALFATLPVWLANALHRFLQYFVGVYFTARVAQEEFDQPVGWAVLSGLLFAAFAYLTVGQLFTLSSVPLLIWLLGRLLQRRVQWLAFIGAGLGFSILTTFSFGVPYLLAFAAIWLLCRKRLSSLADFLHFAAFAAALSLTNLLQLWALGSNVALSHRAGWAPEPIKFSIESLFYTQLQYDLFNQDKFLSALTQTLPWTVFAGGLVWLGVLRLQRRPISRVEAGFAFVAALFLLFAQKWLWLLLQHAVSMVLPWINGLYMGRFFELPASFLIAVGCTLFLRSISVRLSQPIARRSVIVGTCVLAAIMILEPKVFLAMPLGVGDWGQSNYQVEALNKLKASEREPFRVASVLPLQPAYAYGQGLEAADGWANIYPARYRELWLHVLAPLFRELPATRQIFGVDSGRAEDNFVFLGAGLITPGIGKLPDEDVTAAIHSGFDFDRRFNANLLKTLNVKYILSEYPLRGADLRLVHAPAVLPDWPLDRDRNTGVVNSPYPPNRFEHTRGGRWYSLFDRLVEAAHRKARGKDVFVYELQGALPRVWLAQNLRVERDPTALLKALSQADVSSSRTVFVEDDASHPAPPTARGTVQLVEYESDLLRIRTDTDASAIIVVAQNWSPFWTASVDGQPVIAWRVNHVQIGIPVPSGQHTVSLAYRPPYAALLSLMRAR